LALKKLTNCIFVKNSSHFVKTVIFVELSTEKFSTISTVHVVNTQSQL